MLLGGRADRGAVDGRPVEAHRDRDPAIVEAGILAFVSFLKITQFTFDIVAKDAENDVRARVVEHDMMEHREIAGRVAPSEDRFDAQLAGKVSDLIRSGDQLAEGATQDTLVGGIDIRLGIGNFGPLTLSGLTLQDIIDIGGDDMIVGDVADIADEGTTDIAVDAGAEVDLEIVGQEIGDDLDHRPIEGGTPGERRKTANGSRVDETVDIVEHFRLSETLETLGLQELLFWTPVGGAGLMMHSDILFHLLRPSPISRVGVERRVVEETVEKEQPVEIIRGRFANHRAIDIEDSDTFADGDKILAVGIGDTRHKILKMLERLRVAVPIGKVGRLVDTDKRQVVASGLGCNGSHKRKQSQENQRAETIHKDKRKKILKFTYYLLRQLVGTRFGASLAVDAHNRLGIALAEMDPAIEEIDFDAIDGSDRTIGHSSILVGQPTEESVDIHIRSKVLTVLRDDVIGIGLAQLADRKTLLSQKGKKESHTDEGITASMEGRIDDASVAFTTDDSMGLTHESGYVHLAHSGSGIRATVVASGDIAQST